MTIDVHHNIMYNVYNMNIPNKTILKPGGITKISFSKVAIPESVSLQGLTGMNECMDSRITSTYS